MVRSLMFGLFFGLLSIEVCSAGLILTGTAYTENFNGGLPTNWTTRTGASATSLGNSVALGNGNWSTATGQFFSSASVTGLASNASTATQNAAADRALAVRQTASFGDHGAAFVLEIDNTTGFNGFGVSFNAELQSEQDRTTSWLVDYGFGAIPTSFTSIGSVNLGTVFGETSNTLSFGSALDNNTGPVWIRIVTLTNSVGSNSRDTFGIDDFNLNYSITAVPEPSSFGLVGVFVGAGLIFVNRRRRPNKCDD